MAPRGQEKTIDVNSVKVVRAQSTFEAPELEPDSGKVNHGVHDQLVPMTDFCSTYPIRFHWRGRPRCRGQVLPFHSHHPRRPRSHLATGERDMHDTTQTTSPNRSAPHSRRGHTCRKRPSVTNPVNDVLAHSVLLLLRRAPSDGRSPRLVTFSVCGLPRCQTSSHLHP